MEGRKRRGGKQLVTVMYLDEKKQSKEFASLHLFTSVATWSCIFTPNWWVIIYEKI